LSIVAKRALECAAGFWQRRGPTVNHTKRAGDDAVTAAVAYVVLYKHRTDFRSYDRSSWTRLKTARFLAMFANVGQENPAKWIFRHQTDDLISFRTILFQKHDVAPGRCAKLTGVVVRISRPREPIVGDLIPFFARDFASFAADANSWVGKKSDFDVVVHIGMLPLVCALNAFADHRLSTAEIMAAECMASSSADYLTRAYDLVSSLQVEQMNVTKSAPR